MDKDERMRYLQNQTKAILDQLLSMLNEISKSDIVELQDIGRELIDNSELSPRIRSSVKAIFCVGCATLALSKKELEDGKEDDEEEDEEDEDDEEGEGGDGGPSSS